MVTVPAVYYRYGLVCSLFSGVFLILFPFQVALGMGPLLTPVILSGVYFLRKRLERPFIPVLLANTAVSVVLFPLSVSFFVAILVVSVVLATVGQMGAALWPW